MSDNAIPTPTQTLVDTAMESATDNGYCFEDWTYLEIAEDLVQIDSQLEAETPGVIEPMVRDWFTRSRMFYRPRCG